MYIVHHAHHLGFCASATPYYQLKTIDHGHSWIILDSSGLIVIRMEPSIELNKKKVCYKAVKLVRPIWGDWDDLIGPKFCRGVGPIYIFLICVVPQWAPQQGALAPGHYLYTHAHTHLATHPHTQTNQQSHAHHVPWLPSWFPCWWGPLSPIHELKSWGLLELYQYWWFCIHLNGPHCCIGHMKTRF